MIHTVDSLQQGLREAWAHCEEVRTELLATLTAVPAPSWERRVDPTGWNVAQQADHLLRSERGTSKVVRRLIKGAYLNLVPPSGAKVYDSTLTTYPFGPVVAPAPLQPDRLPKVDALRQLVASHARFFEELRRFAGADPDARVAPDPASDLWFTLAGWVRVQSLHEAHHIGQIRRRLL